MGEMTLPDRLFAEATTRQDAANREQIRHVNRICGTVEAPGLIPSAAGASISPKMGAPAPETSWRDLFAGCVLAALVGAGIGWLAIEAMTNHNAARIYQEVAR